MKLSQLTLSPSPTRAGSLLSSGARKRMLPWRLCEIARLDVRPLSLDCPGRTCGYHLLRTDIGGIACSICWWGIRCHEYAKSAELRRQFRSNLCVSRSFLSCILCRICPGRFHLRSNKNTCKRGYFHPTRISSPSMTYRPSKFSASSPSRW